MILDTLVDVLEVGALWTVLIVLGAAIVLNVGERRSRREQEARADANEALARRRLYPHNPRTWGDR